MLHELLLGGLVTGDVIQLAAHLVEVELVLAVLVLVAARPLILEQLAGNIQEVEGELHLAATAGRARLFLPQERPAQPGVGAVLGALRKRAFDGEHVRELRQPGQRDRVLARDLPTGPTARLFGGELQRTQVRRLPAAGRAPQADAHVMARPLCGRRPIRPPAHHVPPPEARPSPEARVPPRVCAPPGVWAPPGAGPASGTGSTRSP